MWFFARMNGQENPMLRLLPVPSSSWSISALLLLSGLLASCSKKVAEPEAPARPLIIAGSYSIGSLAERVGGAEVDVVFVTPEGEDPPPPVAGH